MIVRYRQGPMRWKAPQQLGQRVETHAMRELFWTSRLPRPWSISLWLCRVSAMAVYAVARDFFAVRDRDPLLRSTRMATDCGRG